MNYERLRKELAHKERSVSDLISHIGTMTNPNVPNYSLLLGAGASFTSGIKTGVDLVSEWRKDAYTNLSKKSDYDEAKAREYLLKEHSNWYSIINEYSALFEYKFDLPSQRRRFVEKEVDGRLPSIGYSYLVSLSTSRFFDTIYTTNFDDLINEAFYQFSQSRPIVCAHDSSMQSISINSARPKIIKLHGDYLFDDIKSTLRETESLESNTKSKLTQFSKEYGLIVMGYAGNDRSIMDVISFLLKSDEYLKNGIYWCFREEDYINPELTKLLWKDRVYFVKIDGFDEAMAEIHHGLKSELSLDDNFKNSKKEAILSSFTSDRFNLSDKSKLISSDIENLTKHKNSLDISNLIRELNEKEFNGSEEDFKTFLNIDRLIKDKNYDESINIIKNRVNAFIDNKTKEIYLKKLIKLYKLKGQYSDALTLCNDLIDMDPYQVRNTILKAECYTDLTERVSFIQKNQTNFDDSYPFQNYLLSNALDEIKYNETNSIFNVDTLLEVADKSLKLEPSLDNIAWLFYLDIIEQKYGRNKKLDNKNRNEKVLAILKKAKESNSSHITTQKLNLHPVVINNDYEKVKHEIQSILDIYRNSSINKKEILLKIICDKYSNLSDYNNNESLNSDWTDFFQLDEIKSIDDSVKPVSLTICEANYSLIVEKDVSSAIAQLKSAMLHTDGYKYAHQILQLYLILSKDLKNANKFLERIDEKIESEKRHLLRSNIYESEENYEDAISELTKSRESGLAFNMYITRLTYLYLKQHKYTKTILAIDENIKKLKEQSDIDILIINRELANKKSSGKLEDKVQVRNIISRKLNDNLVLAAECLLENDVNIKRLLKTAIDKDYSNLYYLRCWPVIPQKYFLEYDNKSENTKLIA
ncbi:SIR2 family protein [Pseudoalteromonas distincta]|uniref:SIR2 family protein n=1 Tax=Pseudoalteromonas distincta TaxID=77608 RepID=UPI0032184B21|tara:strand:+ start:242 stop:2854 length:2613 start_codon:yes stop_codon:yes gene_type:complete